MRTSKTRHFSAFGAALGVLTGAATYGLVPAAPLYADTAVEPERTPASVAAPEGPPRLLFVTLDGVRADEFYDCMLVDNLDKSRCSFPKLWKGIRNREFLAVPMVVGNTRAKSLPGYQSIYSGKNQDRTCPDNETCTQVPDETWLEKIRYARGLLPHEVAVIASWNKMPTAVERQPGNIYVNAGLVDMMDPTRDNETVPDLALQSGWQFERRFLPEWENARSDHFTFAYAQWYLTHLRPHVLVASFLDSDELAHLDRYDAYLDKLRAYDGLIQTFIADLKYIRALDNTIIFITTDHGRGSGWFGYTFRGHGPEPFLGNSFNTWAAISVPKHLKDRLAKLAAAHGDRTYTQLDIRPMIEALMIPPSEETPSEWLVRGAAAAARAMQVRRPIPAPSTKAAPPRK